MEFAVGRGGRRPFTRPCRRRCSIRGICRPGRHCECESYEEKEKLYRILIENNYLTIVYDKKELNDLFFDNKFDTDIKIRYLK